MKHRAGFTLIEVLIASVVLSVILSGLIALTTLTLRYTNVMTGQADQLRDLNDITGYMADNIRRAAELRTSTSFETSDGTTVNCALSDPDQPCFAIVVPESRAGVDIDAYVFLAYRLEPRSQLDSALKADDPWADANTFVIKEYRQDLCTPCGSLPSPLPAVDNATAYLVIDQITLDDPAGGLFAPFSHTALSADTDQLTLKVRAKRRVMGRVVYAPGHDVYELAIMTRN